MGYSRRAFFAAAVAAPRQDLAELPLAEVATLIRGRRVSPVELTRLALARIEQRNPALNAFITVTGESALAEAAKLEAEQTRGRFRGPLHGVPIALKDLYDTARVRTTAASAHFATRVPDADAAVVTALRKAGAVILGKLNMDEFAFNFTSETSHFGPVQNPWKRGYTPGGSSGGSAVAVSAGLCWGTLGSDTGGSIRLPAAFCGVVGYKPTYGRISAEGVLPLAWSLDHVGPITRTAGDARLMLAAMGLPLVAPRSLESIRLGVPRSFYWDGLDAETEAAVSAAVKLLARRTAGVREVTLPPLPHDPELRILPKSYGAVIMAEAFTYHQERLAAAPERFHKGTRANLAIGAQVTASDYVRARRDLEQSRAAAAALFGDTDLLLMPTAPGPAFPLGSTADLKFLRNTAPWNFYGLPCISVPCGTVRDGLPVGLQIIGKPGADSLVLAAAERYERERGPQPHPKA